MGRGPGNVRTEYLVMELAALGRTSAVVAPLVNLVERDFADLRRTYEWGSNLYYFMSANRSIHPTYVMELTKDDRYSPTEIVGALDKLGERGASSFDIRRLTEAVEGASLRYPGGANVSGWCNAREVLLVGNGPEARAKRAEIEMFIRRNSPFVIGLNAHVPIDSSLLDAVVVCHPERAVMDAVALSELDCEVVAPAALLRELGISVKSLRDVGVSVEQNSMSMSDRGVVIPQPVVAGYALALAHYGEAKRVWLAGLDGYSDGDPRQAMMLDTLRNFSALAPDTAVVSITRTTYPVRQQSIFAP
jgi:4-hydroxy 2-oxovalerate aldolase